MKGNYETMTEFVAQINDTEEAKADYVVPTGEIRMADDGEQLMFGSAAYSLTGHAHGQVATYTGIPKKYYDRMAAVPQLRAENVNTWMDAAGERRMVRTIDQRARAVLSDRFRPIDNMLVLSALLPTMNEHSDLQVVSRAIGEKRMYLQVVFPRLQGEVAQGDVVQAGVTITNSEVGAGAVDISSTIWRLVCKNGMVGASRLHKNHVGSRIDLESADAYNVFRDDTIAAEIESLRLRLRDVFASAMTESAFQSQLAQLRNATDDRVEDVFETAKNVTKHYGLSEDASQVLAGNVIEERNPNRYGFANALTWYAQSLDNMDHQYDLERRGSDLITMQPREWKGLAA